VTDLSNLGRREEALAATTEAVDVYRRLAGVNPAAFEPDLARGLWSFAWVRVAGQIELPQALTAAAEESVTRYDELTQQLPQAFTNDLNGALATLAGARRPKSHPGGSRRLPSHRPAQVTPCLMRSRSVCLIDLEIDVRERGC
jgi:hypothetical protein